MENYKIVLGYEQSLDISETVDAVTGEPITNVGILTGYYVF